MRGKIRRRSNNAYIINKMELKFYSGLSQCIKVLKEWFEAIGENTMLRAETTRKKKPQE